MGEKHRKALSSLALTYVSPLQDLRFDKWKGGAKRRVQSLDPLFTSSVTQVKGKLT